MGWNEIYLRDQRYDAVIHMVTAADGAEKFYGLESNEARYEGIQRAVEVDHLIQKNWTGHSQLYLIDNNVDSFDEKIKRVERTVLNLVGIPQSTIFNCKYLISVVDDIPHDINYEKLEVLELYLTGPPNTQSKLIKKGISPNFNYVMETKKLEEGEEITRRRIITSRDFILYNQERNDPDKIKMKKKRVSFMYKNQHYIIDTFVNVDGAPSLLRIETEKEKDQVEIPDFIHTIREVTDEEQYSTYEMTNKSYILPKDDKEALEKKIKELTENKAL